VDRADHDGCCGCARVRCDITHHGEAALSVASSMPLASRPLRIRCAELFGAPWALYAFVNLILSGCAAASLLPHGFREAGLRVARASAVVLVLIDVIALGAHLAGSRAGLPGHAFPFAFHALFAWLLFRAHTRSRTIPLKH
jgi:uncharacterized membrane protein